MIKIARAEAEEVGAPVRAPPRPLEEGDRAIIESALLAPAAQFEGVEAYPDLPAKTAVLAYALAKSQACVDGNKRIAFLLVAEFLSINGADLEASTEEAARMILDAATSDPRNRDETVLELAIWFESHIAGSEF